MGMLVKERFKSFVVLDFFKVFILRDWYYDGVLFLCLDQSLLFKIVVYYLLKVLTELS